MDTRIGLALSLTILCHFAVFSQNYIPPISEKYIISRDTTPEGKVIIGINIPGSPPPTTYNKTAAKRTSTAVILDDVPALSWCFGCAPTAAAMIAGYYDRNGYVNMYTGPTNSGLFPLDNSSWGTTVINSETWPLCPLSATMNGLDGRTSRGHVDDYWIQYLDSTDDPYITNGWTEHTHEDCTADYMLTSQSVYSNTDGLTKVYYYTDGSPTDLTEYYPTYADGSVGFKLFMQSRGYTVSNLNTQLLYGYNGNTKGFTFSDFKAEIDAGRPVLIHLYTYPDGHFMIGVGYDNSTQTIYIYNTWDYSEHTMTWGGTYSAMQHNAVTTYELSTAGKVPDNLLVTNTNYSSGIDSCLDALDTITVAGDGNAVALQSGSVVDFIAGASISFLPGFHAYSGSAMNAGITTEYNFCTPVPSSSAAAEALADAKSASVHNKENNLKTTGMIDKQMVVYPNPSEGMVTVELTNLAGSSDITVSNTLGVKVYRSTVTDNQVPEIDLTDQPKGIYFITLKNEKTIITKKIILR